MYHSMYSSLNYSLYWIIFGFFMILSFVVQRRLKSKFEKYSKEPLNSGLSGRDIAEKMLRENGINDVSITCVSGYLTDHYNPVNKTLNLSPDVYDGKSVAAAAVAAHECGHAVQHAEAYAWLNLRSALVPAVQFGATWSQWVLLAGLFLLAVSPFGKWILLIGIALFALTTIFAFVTLPVEFNASKRALEWIQDTNTVTGEQYDHAKDALRWAARTYEVAAVSSLATLLYYIAIFARRN
ncbi:MAG: zinc metallopeptidase [Bacteroidales bacterium]|nr:zinc metallopeptidase [Bacteroidales bacterium]